MEKAAAAAWEVIKLADKGIYSLTPFENYRDMFGTKDAEYPWTPEIIFHKWSLLYGKQSFNKHGRYFSPSRFYGAPINNTPNQAYIDRFEMADGTRYKIEYDNDNSKRWDFRDPRFRQNVIVDRDKWGYHKLTVFEMYEGGMDKGSGVAMFTPYVIKKYWPKGVNKYDGEWNNFQFANPLMRLADVYLFYAEAVNEAYGANGSVPGSSLTAVGAVNIVRQRAGMPPVTSAADGYESFRKLVWNERCVELCWESSYWFDIRRWHVAHLPEYKPIVDLKFDKDWTNFERVVLQEMYFEDKHYWFPISKGQTQLYEGFGQNPGW
jgi:starch-binding outer membrane protein, SusD/RagB family